MVDDLIELNKIMSKIHHVCQRYANPILAVLLTILNYQRLQCSMRAHLWMPHNLFLIRYVCTENRGVDVYTTEQPTNGVGYFKALINAQRIPRELRFYLPLLSGYLAEMGAADMDYRMLSHELELHTGGISAGNHEQYQSITIYFGTYDHEGVMLSSV
jgi:hypothetical protein